MNDKLKWSGIKAFIIYLARTNESENSITIHISETHTTGSLCTFFSTAILQLT
jgi:hypothetical protein